MSIFTTQPEQKSAEHKKTARTLNYINPCKDQPTERDTLLVGNGVNRN